MNSEIKDTVGLTSRYMAAVRAIEHQRPDCLFSDPLAEKLAGAEIIAEIAPRAQEYEDRGRPVVAVRTRFFDDFLMSSASFVRQVILLGAGMDTRAFRLSWHPDTHLYELDRPDVMQLKESLLDSTPAKCHRQVLSIDLRGSWSEKLIERGFETTSPSIWLLEGVVYYLSEADVRALLKTITDLSTNGSFLGADVLNEKMKNSDNGLAKYWKSGFDEPEKLFAEFGWQASVVQFGDETANFGRFKYKFPSREVPDIARGFLVTARKEA